MPKPDQSWLKVVQLFTSVLLIPSFRNSFQQINKSSPIYSYLSNIINFLSGFEHNMDRRPHEISKIYKVFLYTKMKSNHFSCLQEYIVKGQTLYNFRITRILFQQNIQHFSCSHDKIYLLKIKYSTKIFVCFLSYVPLENFHPSGDVVMTVEGLQILTFTRH